MTVELPNIRKQFVPDPGYVLFDVDLAGADAQVVAWEAEDEDLKRAFRSGLDIHVKNATDVLGEEFTKLEKGTYAYSKVRKQSKTSVHLTNYGGTAFTMNRNPIISWPLNKCETFQRDWFRLHPGVKHWHNRTDLELQTRRTIKNAFGYRIVYFDRLDGLLPQALAWVPQSTVALVTFKAAIKLVRECPWVEMLLQVHDSLVFQVPFHAAERYDDILRGLRVEVPYKDPLVIPWGMKCSTKSWGDCEEPEGVNVKQLQGMAT